MLFHDLKARDILLRKNLLSVSTRREEGQGERPAGPPQVFCGAHQPGIGRGLFLVLILQSPFPSGF